MVICPDGLYFLMKIMVPGNGENILYGSTPARGAEIEPYTKIADDGTVEYYDHRNQLVQLSIPEGAERMIDGAELKGPVVAHLSQGQLHREDGPAVVNENGQYWIRHGKQHREDGPAIINDDGEAWLQEGELHRDADLDGTTGPALTINGAKWWYRHGRPHREDGPAVISTNGFHQEFWLGGKKYFDQDAYLDAVDDLKSEST